MHESFRCTNVVFGTNMRQYDITPWKTVHLKMPAVLQIDTKFPAGPSVSSQEPTTSSYTKGKVHPRTDHEGPEGELRYRSTPSLTSALDWGEGVVNATPRPFYPRERPGTYCIGGWVGPRAGSAYSGPDRASPHPNFQFLEERS